MNTGSIAIALNAEYGELCPSCISLSGRNCTKSKPADSSQRANGTRSGSSPMPQLCRDGIEKSGTSTPACRRLLNRRPPLPMGTLQHTLHAVAEQLRLWQQTQNEERLMGKIEEETRMDE